MDSSNQQAQPSANQNAPAHQQQQDHASGSSSAQTGSAPASLLRCEWLDCGQRMDTPELLYDHVCERHVGRKSTNNLNLTCSWGTCRTTTVKRDHITSHIRVHIPLKPHKCDFCQKAFKRPQDLKKHVKTHAEEPSFQPSPEPSRSLPHQQQGYGPPGKMNDMQHMTTASYYPDQQQMHTAPPVYHQQYQNGGPGNPNAYHPGHSQPHYQSHYATTIYPVPSTLNAEYEVRKKATMDALNEFFGDIKTRQLDPGAYGSVSQRLMHLHSLPSLAGATEYSSGTAVATAAAAPLASHYTLPLSNVRTKQDLHSIDHFLESVQTTIYEHETSSGAAAAGVAQPGAHILHAGVNYRTSNSPTQLSTAPQVTSHILPPPMTATSNDTPALTPASSVVSYNSPGSVHSQTISPVVHQSNVSLYPTLPSVTASADANGYTTTSSAMPPSLATSFDPDGRRRYEAGLLQAARRDADDDSLPEIHRLGVGSPSMAKMEPPPAYGGQYHARGVQSSAIDPTLDSVSVRAHEREDPDWLTIVRVVEELRDFVHFRIEHGVYEEEDGPRGMGRGLERENERLYPSIRSDEE